MAKELDFLYDFEENDYYENLLLENSTFAYNDEESSSELYNFSESNVQIDDNENDSNEDDDSDLNSENFN